MEEERDEAIKGCNGECQKKGMNGERKFSFSFLIMCKLFIECV